MSKTQLFIEKARAKHGNVYDYSKTVYVRSKDKLIITCGTHGYFEKTPEHHLRGQGCPLCSLEKAGKLSIAKSAKVFVEKARLVHGDRYNYDKVVYSGGHHKVSIVCKTHGVFTQQPSNHLSGNGCVKCAGQYSYSTGEWIRVARKIHGDKFDYSKVEYVNARKKINIICSIHGEFSQVPHAHLSGQGCSRCTVTHPYDLESWVAAAHGVHGDKFDYSKVVYVRSTDKVVIGCRKHGDFNQKPNDHIQGRSCPRCLYDRSQPTKIYIMQMGEQVKIGISIDPEARLGQLNRSNPKHAGILATWTLEDFPSAFNAEQQIHRELAGFNAGLTGFDGATEWFDTTPEYATMVIERILKPITTNYTRSNLNANTTASQGVSSHHRPRTARADHNGMAQHVH